MKGILNDSFFHEKGYQISTDKALLEFDVIYNYLDGQSYWAKGIPIERLHRAIDNALCFGIYHKQQQVGFARIISDYATFAYLADVFVLEEHRGLGLSKWLVQTIVNHPDLQGLRRWSLATLDAHALYAQFGFQPVSKPELWMEIYNPYPVPQKEEK